MNITTTPTLSPLIHTYTLTHPHTIFVIIVMLCITVLCKAIQYEVCLHAQMMKRMQWSMRVDQTRLYECNVKRNSNNWGIHVNQSYNCTCTTNNMHLYNKLIHVWRTMMQSHRQTDTCWVRHAECWFKLSKKRETTHILAIWG